MKLRLIFYLGWFLGLGDNGNWESSKVKKFNVNLILTCSIYFSTDSWVSSHCKAFQTCPSLFFMSFFLFRCTCHFRQLLGLIINNFKLIINFCLLACCFVIILGRSREFVDFHARLWLQSLLTLRALSSAEGKVRLMVLRSTHALAQQMMWKLSLPCCTVSWVSFSPWRTSRLFGEDWSGKIDKHIESK